MPDEETMMFELSTICYKENKFVWTGTSRPNFDGIANFVFKGGDGDKCHSISWFTMKKLVLEQLNSLADSQDRAVNVLQAFHYIFLVMSIRVFRDTKSMAMAAACYYSIRTITETFEGLKKSICTGDTDEIAEKANSYLCSLFSAVGNLRLPNETKDGNKALNWNQSVGPAYDPREWAYIEEGRVLYDNTGKDLGKDGKPYAEYERWNGDLKPEQTGFYLLNSLDHCILSRLLSENMGGGQASQFLCMYTGCDPSGKAILVSSSNEMEKPDKWDECDKPIYFVDAYTNTWVSFNEILDVKNNRFPANELDG